MWGSSVKTLAMIDRANEQGLDVTADQYPYTATSTGLTIVFPAWSLEGGDEKIKERLEDPELRKAIKEGIVHNILYDRGGGDPGTIVVSSYPPDSTLEGKNLAEITRLRGQEPTPGNAAETLRICITTGAVEVFTTAWSRKTLEKLCSIRWSCMPPTEQPLKW